MPSRLRPPTVSRRCPMEPRTDREDGSMEHAGSDLAPAVSADIVQGHLDVLASALRSEEAAIRESQWQAELQSECQQQRISMLQGQLDAAYNSLASERQARERLQRDVIMKNKEIKALQKELQLQQQLTATAEEGVRSACAWVAQLNRSTASPPPPPPAGIAKQAAAAAPTDAPTDASRATFHSPGPNRLAMAAHPVVSTPPDSANAARRCDDCTRLRERVEQLERAMQATSTAPTALKGDHGSFSPGGDVGGGFVGGGGGDGGGESGVGGGGGLMPRPQRGGIATERSGIPRMHAAELPDPLEEELAAAKAELRSLLSMEAPAIGVRRGGAARGGGYPGHVRAVDSPPAVSPFRVSSSRVSPSRVSPARVSPARVSPSPPRALSVPRHTPDRTRRFSGSRGHGSHDALSSTRRSLEERLDAELEAFSEEQQSQAQLLRASIAIMKKGLEYP